MERRDTKVTARLNAQGAMLEELRALVPSLRPDFAREDARQLVLEKNVLLRPSIGSRVDVLEKLSVRYFRADKPKTLSLLVQAIQTNPNELGLFAYTALLWNDALVFLLGCEWLAPKLAGPPFLAVTRDIELELQQLASKVPAIIKWTEGTRRKVAAHYLGLLRDCGYAKGAARKQLQRPFVSPEVVFFGAQLIIASGERPARVPEHDLFKAMGLSIDDVIAALTELRSSGRIDFGVQGGIARFAVQE